MAGKRRRQSAQMSADAAYENLQANSLYGQLSSAASRWFWWYTGYLEITLGAWLIIVGVIYTAFPIDGVSSVVGWVLFGFSLAIPALLPMALRSRVILPSGMCISAPMKPRPNKALLALGVLTYAGIAAAALLGGMPSEPFVVAGAVLALAALLAYAISGCSRHFVLAACLMLSLPAVGSWAYGVPLMGAVDSAGAQGGIEALMPLLGASGVRTMTMALAVITVGALAFACGMFALVTAGKQRAVARADQHEAQRIVVNLASPDERMRFITAIYVCKNPTPAAVAQLAYGSFDPNIALAKTMRLALTRIWGESADERFAWFISHSSLKGKKAVEYTAEEWRMRKAARREFEAAEQAMHDSVASELRRQSYGGYLQDCLQKLTQKHDDAALCATAAQLLGCLQGQGAASWLAAGLVAAHDDRGYAAACATGLANGGKDAAVCVASLMEDERPWVRGHAINAACGLLQNLRRCGASRDLEFCKQAFGDVALKMVASQDCVVRGRSMMLLSHYGSAVAPIVAQRCADKSAYVRARALYALSEVDEYLAGVYVFDALLDTRFVVREAAVSCAGKLRLIRAMNRIEVLVNDPHEAVSARANEFLLMSQGW